ncbi:MAG: carbamate kinase [bacterium]|nr:carbamate kinase [bacterium]
MSKIVVALGGNALQREGEAAAHLQEKVAHETIKQLIPLIQAGNELVIVHGNGPQVGNIVLHEEAIDTETTPAMPLHACVGMTQGMIGYWLQKALGEEFSKNGISKNAATIVTQIEVSKDDPAFRNPTKPIGPFYSEEEAQRIATEKGYEMREDAGRGWRHVVASPKPIQILETPTIKNLLNAGTVVIAAGGGGIPVRKTENGDFEGVDAVIDKDFAAELLAREIGADTLLILTAVDNAMINYGQENQEKLGQITPEQAQEFVAQNQFAAGSMLPKVQASIHFAENGGRAIITSLENAKDAIEKNLGTVISK